MRLAYASEAGPLPAQAQYPAADALPAGALLLNSPARAALFVDPHVDCEHPQDDASVIAEAYVFRGERDQAFAWLERAYQQKDSGLYLIKLDQLLKRLADDPRYPDFLRKMNLPD